MRQAALDGRFPLSIEYRYPGEGRVALAGILREIAERTGIEVDVDSADGAAGVYEALLDLTGRLLSHIESAYRVTFRAPAPASPEALRRRILTRGAE